MKIYTLMGNTDYEGDTLLGSFASMEDLMQFVQADHQGVTQDFDALHVYEHQLGQPVEYLMQYKVL